MFASKFALARDGLLIQFLSLLHYLLLIFHITLCWRLFLNLIAKVRGRNLHLRPLPQSKFRIIE